MILYNDWFNDWFNGWFIDWLNDWLIDETNKLGIEWSEKRNNWGWMNVRMKR